MAIKQLKTEYIHLYFTKEAANNDKN